MDISDGGALSHGLVDVGLGQSDLVLVLLLVLSKLSALEGGPRRKKKVKMGKKKFESLT